MNREELFWKYAEGKCSPEEMAKVEKLMATDVSFKMEMKLIKEVNSHLMKTEPAGPSMRFSKNVMEALPPNFYPPISVNSLVGSFWKKIFLGSLGLTILIAIIGAFGSSSPDMDLLSPYTEQAVDKVNGVVSALPPVTVQFFILTAFSLLTLALIDKLFFSKVNE